ncbi:lasso RiPP family leader peptide-containing protein [Nocardia terpenica]|nr:lasso RiPP family leader peptide-containing protein [Nocardia terpenica]MBF6061418.1 lasso RiPP family leader peptide-containing protein [Nocardia terpenica]MBF6105353.1 lasso RiPP family leader peptide-containing protein [Nocardia terpenica]MBF6113177.1 lasso RiPP family leader peptide-containing protein [Nocardia terpenica]MBF6119307.1 lasso RiPP family leader peptide-containing protein [Nocardia terpenica]NQE92400.1 lasso RiPP family leader peptide-containing protein [Nocardia terpenica]
MQQESVYESPVLFKVGTFEYDTQGWYGSQWDGPTGQRD